MIPIDALPRFEDMIYLPMVLIILERDRAIIEKSPFKFKRPYLNVIEQAEKNVRDEFKKAKIYMKRNDMKLVKGSNDGTFTEYKFYKGGYEEQRRYLNVRLRNRTEELLNVYFAMTSV